MERAGIREVADLAGVAIGTVSNYLNHPDRVSEARARRIRYAIESLGFVPSNAGRQLRLGTSSVIGYIAPDVSNPYFAEIAESVERRAGERGVSVFLGNSHRSRAREDAYLRVFEQHRVRGLLASSHVDIEDRLAAVRARGTPSVLVGQRAATLEQPSVSLDDVSGGRQAAEHLLSVGCRRIAFVGGPLGIPQVADRLAGASAVVRAAGAATLEVIDAHDRTVAGGLVVGAEFAARPPELRPDGVFAVNDLLAIGMLSSLTAAGVDVPRRMALVGYDDIEFAEASLVPLSTVRGRHEGFGEAVVDMLFDAIEGVPMAEPHRVFTPDLVIRRSSAGFAR